MLSFLLNIPSWVLPFLFVLTLIITVHEFGHFLVAKWLGVAVDEFSIGFGRPLIHWRDKAGVQWRLGWIPIGGYVRFSGDENAASVPDGDSLEALRREIVATEGAASVKRYYHFRPIWQRAAIAAAGPMANFVLAVVIFAALLMTVGGPNSIGDPATPAKVGGILPGSPAALAGFQTGDLILQAGGKNVSDFSQLPMIISRLKGVPTTFVVRRGGANVSLVAAPRYGVLAGECPGAPRPAGPQTAGVYLGLCSPEMVVDRRLHRRNPIEAVVGGVRLTWDVLATTVSTIGGIVTGQISAHELGGPIGIAQASHAIAQDGAAGAHGLGQQLLGSFVNLLVLSAIVSVGIGFMNLMPIPVLDGGHLLFYAYEAAVRRPVDAAIQAVGYRVGLALLLGLMLFATANDLQRINLFHFLGGPSS